MKPSTEKGFREKIRARCRSIGTYKPEFEIVIHRLAEYYLRQDQLKTMYTESGGVPVIAADGTAVKNPILDEMDKTNRLILELERELGLTPAALRKLNEAAMAKQAEDPLAAAIKGLRVV